MAVTEREEVGLRTESVEEAGAPVGLVQLAKGLEHAPLPREAPEARARAVWNARIVGLLAEATREGFGRFARLGGPRREALGRGRVLARDALGERVAWKDRRLECESDLGQEATLRLGSLFGGRMRDLRSRVR